MNPVVPVANVSPLTDVGVIAPNPIVKAGVLVAVAQVAVTPLLAAAVETEVTVPEPNVPEVGKVMLVGPVVVNVKLLAPEVVRFPPRVIVLVPLFTPVPPLAADSVPVASVARLSADQDGFPDAFPCSTVVVVPWLAKSADASKGLLNEGVADEPVKFPKNVCEPALERVNDRDGVDVAVLTDVVNSGLKVPAEKLVTVPVGALTHVGTPAPFDCNNCPDVPAAVYA